MTAIEPYFLEDIRALLDAVAGETRADEFAYYEFDDARKTLTFRLGSAPQRRDDAQFTVLTYPLGGALGLSGVVDFRFRRHAPITPAQTKRLSETATTVAALLQNRQGASRHEN